MPGGIAHHKTLRVGVLGVGVVIGLAGRALQLLEVFLIIELLHLKQSGKNELCNRGKTELTAAYALHHPQTKGIQ